MASSWHLRALRGGGAGLLLLVFFFSLPFRDRGSPLLVVLPGSVRSGRFPFLIPVACLSASIGLCIVVF